MPLIRISPIDPGAKPPGCEVSRTPITATGQCDRRDQPQPRTPPHIPAPHPVPAASYPSRGRGVTPLRGLFLQSTESHLGDAEAKEASRDEAPPEPEPPNPFSQLTDQELEEYKQEVERKKLQGRKGKGEPRSQIPFHGAWSSSRLCWQARRLLWPRRARLPLHPHRRARPRRLRSPRRVSEPMGAGDRRMGSAASD